MTIISKRLFPVLASATLGLTLFGSATAASADELAPAQPDPLQAVDSCAFDGPQLVCNVSHPSGVAGVTVTVFGQGIQGEKHFSYMTCSTNREIRFDPPSPNYTIEVHPCSSDDPDFAPDDRGHDEGRRIAGQAKLASGQHSAAASDSWSDFCWEAETVKNKQACELGWVQ